MSPDRTLKHLYSDVDRRQAVNAAQAITKRLRSDHDIATDEGMVGTRELRDSISSLNISVDTRLVDLGSGSAEPSRWISAQTGCSLVGVDVSPERITRIPLTAQVQAIRADLSGGLPFCDSAFNASVQYDSIVHVADRGTYLDELRRITEPGSILALTSSTNQPLSEREQLGLGDVPGTIWRLTTSELEAVLERHGWRVSTIRSRREEMLAYHSARRDCLLAAKEHLENELPKEDFERLVNRAATVAELLHGQRLDMIFLTAVRRD
jgi:SAM-dependent methyltransferase